MFRILFFIAFLFFVPHAAHAEVKIIPLMCNNCESLPPFEKSTCRGAFEQIVVDTGDKSVLLQLLGTHWGEVHTSLPLSGDDVDCDIDAPYKWQCVFHGEILYYKAIMTEKEFSMEMTSTDGAPTRIKRCHVVQLR
jgi:hypothetical protein